MIIPRKRTATAVLISRLATRVHVHAIGLRRRAFAAAACEHCTQRMGSGNRNTRSSYIRYVRSKPKPTDMHTKLNPFWHGFMPRLTANKHPKRNAYAAQASQRHSQRRSATIFQSRGVLARLWLAASQCVTHLSECDCSFCGKTRLVRQCLSFGSYDGHNTARQTLTVRWPCMRCPRDRQE
jgi:hypothetical protein